VHLYVAPDGRADADGSESAPLDLATALSLASPARPGDTILLRGGIYRGTFMSYLTGTEGAPITVRQYPGERATIDSSPSAESALTLHGAWTWYWGFEIMSSEPTRVFAVPGIPPDLTRGAGVTAFGDHLTLINLIVHDMGLQGLGIWTGSDDTEAYGNVIYANGWLGSDGSHGHGIYTQSRYGVRRLTDNLIFNQFDHGIHAFGSASAFLNNIQLRGNIIFNNGIFQPGNYERNILVGGQMGPESMLNPVAIENYTYFNSDRPSGRANNFGYNGGCTNLLMRDNYIAHWTMNTLVLILCSGEIRGNFLLGYVDPILPNLYPDNEYRHVPNGNFPPPEMRPTGTRVFVRPNRYEPGRAHIAVFNWDNLSSVDLDLSGIGLAPGTPFEIKDAQNYFGVAVVSGIYDGGLITIPTTATVVATPVGNVPTPAHSTPEFNAFVVRPLTGGLPPLLPTATLSALPASIEPGESTSLNWTTSNSASASIDHGVGTVDLSGSVEVSPTVTTVYRVTAVNDAGVVVTATATVTVRQPNVSPVITLTLPSGPFVAPATINLSATASDQDGSVVSVAFLNGPTLLMEDTTHPYSFQWTNVPAGVYQLTARVRDNHNATTTSTAVTVTVNGLPTVTLTATATPVSSPSVIALTATAADIDGTVAKVVFFSGLAVLGEDTTSPFEFSWPGVAAGSYQFTARAYDNLNGVTTSAPITVVLNAAPTVSATVAGGPFIGPASVALAATASDTDGTITKVEFYQGVTRLAEDTVAPFSFQWTGVAAGDYVVTARAYDNRGGITISAPVAVVVTANVLPQVSLTTSGTLFTAPAVIELVAIASDGDGEVAKVAFYKDGIRLIEDAVAPYEYRWADVSAGTYQLTVRAYDNRGAEMVSAPITVAVNGPPTISLAMSPGPFVAPATIAINATATDVDGSVARVTFYEGANLLGEDTIAPFSFQWADAPAGNYQLTARAYDNRNAEKISAPIAVVVNAPPQVSVGVPSTPLVGPLTIDLTATASDADGVIARVVFYQGTTRLGEDITSPYSFRWLNVGAGSYQITARAYDNRGTETISAPAPIVVAANVPPTVTVSTTGTLFPAPATFDVNVTALDTDGQITRVAFYQGATRLSEDTLAPYTYRWANAAAGTYQLTARAYDDRGGEATSAAVTVVVNILPTVTLTVPTGLFATPTTVGLSATAADSDGSVARVAFYHGATIIGEDMTAPFSFPWTDAPAGTYQLTARAYDNRGAEKISLPVTLSINAPPTVGVAVPGGPLVGPATVDLGATATDSDGTVVRVAFYQGAIKIGEDYVAPYTFKWLNVAAGTYQITARAYDNRGTEAISMAATLAVAPNVRPMVTLSTTGTLFTAPATLDLNATALDTDGQITRVAFYYGATRLGEDTTPPYAFRWLSAQAGSYQVTARAYDDRGGETISAAVAIVVNVLPTVSLTVPTGLLVAPANVGLSATAADADGSVARVSFYHGTTFVGEDTTAPFSFPWTSIPAGSYQLTARAYDNRGAERISAPVAMLVNARPTVSVAVPGGSLVGPMTLDLTATATDSDGTITRVTFYQGATRIGDVYASPFAFRWVNVAAGTYQITARAYDNRGTETISAPVPLIVAANIRPTIGLVLPPPPFTAPVVIPLSADASDTDGQITKVSFYLGPNPIGEDTSAPYTFQWNAPVGTYQLTALAYDDRGGRTTSQPVAVTILPANVLPSVSISVSGGSFVAPGTFTLNAGASDSDGIIKVEFYQGTTYLGEDAVAPYAWPLTNVATGSYSFTARAYDNRGGQRTSTAIAVTVR
jgi:hypothetical protein